MLAAMVSCSTTGVQRDWFEKNWVKAQTGDAEAQDAVAYHYQKGKVVDKDIQEAVKWYRKAAEQGNISAQSSLMSLYSWHGELANKKPQECYYWAMKVYHHPNATARDIMDSSGELYHCYDEGYGVEKNPEKAAEWKAIYYEIMERIINKS